MARIHAAGPEFPGILTVVVFGRHKVEGSTVFRTWDLQFESRWRRMVPRNWISYGMVICFGDLTCAYLYRHVEKKNESNF